MAASTTIATAGAPVTIVVAGPSPPAAPTPAVAAGAQPAVPGSAAAGAHPTEVASLALGGLAGALDRGAAVATRPAERVRAGGDLTSMTTQPVSTTVPPATTLPAATTTATTTTLPPATTLPPMTTSASVPPATTTRAAALAGTVVGSQAHPVPAGAVVVSPAGVDTAPGTADQPVRTIARALALAPGGGTIVLRAGSYPETVNVTKRVTIQNWPGEQAWLDGSVVVPTWVNDGAMWRAEGWTVEFDSSPTYTRGAPDATQADWGFVNPSYPMAAHPDQIWVDGLAQRQVSSLAEVVPGAFFHDEAADRLYLGSDPTGREVRAAALVRAMSVRADGVVLRGFGIHRYAPSVPDMGTVTLERTGILVEHVAVMDVATTGISVVAANNTIRRVTIARAGMLGLHGNGADGIVVDGLWSEGNNTERFNSSPVSGGLKVTRSRGVTVRNSTMRANNGPGIWLDESVYDMTVVGNDLRANTGHGASLEISARALFADNVVQGNGGFGVKVNNTSDVAIWNNTFVGNNRSINIVQDGRRYGDGSPGQDPRHPNDPTMTWLLGPVVVSNNIVANQLAGNCLLCVEDYSRQRTAEQIGVTADGNAYNRPNTGTPSWVVVWSTGAGNPAVFTTLDTFRYATGQEAGGVLVTGAAIADSTGVPTASLPVAPGGVPLPADVAARVGRDAGTQRLGAW
jgi:trimeric autotransporter adhesin